MSDKYLKLIFIFGTDSVQSQLTKYYSKNINFILLVRLKYNNIKINVKFLNFNYYS